MSVPVAPPAGHQQHDNKECIRSYIQQKHQEKELLTEEEEEVMKRGGASSIMEANHLEILLIIEPF